MKIFFILCGLFISMHLSALEQGESAISLNLDYQTVDGEIKNEDIIKIENKKKYEVIITEGSKVGRVNGLAVIGSGAALLKDLEKVERILNKLSTLNIPISCKIRLGVNEKNIVALELAKIVEKYCCAIAVHARTLEQGYSGKANWSYIKLIKENVSIPVIGNGDINKVEDVKKMIDETGCDYVMIGRRAMKDPFFFRRANHYLKTGEVLPEESFEEKIELLVEYLQLCKKYNCFEPNNFKLLFIQFSRGYRNSSKLRVEISRIKKFDELLLKVRELC